MTNTFDFTPIQKPYFIPQWDGICRVDADPPESSDDPGEPTPPNPPPTASTGSDEIENPENLLKALNLYKQEIGSVKDAKRIKERSQVYENIAAAITAEGFNPEDLPGIVKQIKDREVKDKELADQYQAKVQLLESEHRRKLSETERRAVEAETALLDDRRAQSVFPMFNANALPEAIDEWAGNDGYWKKISKFIEFEENGNGIKRVLGPDRQPMFISEPGKETREADLTDLISGMVEGKYGFTLKQAMKPISMATGGGVVNPARGGANTIPRAALGRKTPQELKILKEQMKRGEVRVVD
jgi:hypothetical protein